MKVPAKLNRVTRPEARELIEDSAYLALSDYQSAEDSTFDPVFDFVARLERLERLDDYYATH